MMAEDEGKRKTGSSDFKVLSDGVTMRLTCGGCLLAAYDLKSFL